MMLKGKNFLATSAFRYAIKRFTNSQREKCIRPVPAVCSVKNQNLPECTVSKDKEKLQALERKKLETKVRFISMWENPECCADNCILEPRYDALYYSISDKQKRKYPKTWLDCRTEKKPILVCCSDELDLKLPQKRKKTKSACEYIPYCETKSRCARVVLPGCKKSRIPPKCSITRKPTICQKICSPYPAFSECLQKKGKPLRPVECRCLRMPPICVLYEELEKGIIKIVKKPKTE